MKLLLLSWLLNASTVIFHLPLAIAGRKAKIKQKYTTQTVIRVTTEKLKYPKTLIPTEKPSELGEIMLKHHLYPKLLHVLPKARCNVTYSGGGIANAGNTLPFKEIKRKPNVTWEANPNEYYTLIFRDIDDIREPPAWHTWLIVNIPGNDTIKGTVILDYKKPPLVKSGSHHLVFLVYKQSFKLLEKNVIEHVRKFWKFDLNSFISIFQLSEPLGNFFLVNYRGANKVKYTTRNWTCEFLEAQRLHD